MTAAPVELWVEARQGRPAVNPVMAALLGLLAEAGSPARVRVPELDRLGEPPGPEPALVLLKTATTLGLSTAVAAEAGGGRFLNPAAASSAAGDKAAVLARLAAAGVPVPESYLVAPGAVAPGAVDTPAAGPGAWVSKPVLGWHGIGVTFHGSLAEAQDHPAPPVPDGHLLDDGTRIVQRRVGAAEPDVKVYVAGEQVFAAAKAFDAASFTRDAVEPLELDRRHLDVVRAAGEATGLRLYGVDLRGGPDPVVIDVNPFPGYRGFPAAAPALLAEIHRALREGDR